MWGQNAHVIQTLYICKQVCVCVVLFFYKLKFDLGQITEGVCGFRVFGAQHK